MHDKSYATFHAIVVFAVVDNIFTSGGTIVFKSRAQPHGLDSLEFKKKCMTGNVGSWVVVAVKAPV
eukprot:5360230-Amphidinium_carterae.1